MSWKQSGMSNLSVQSSTRDGTSGVTSQTPLLQKSEHGSARTVPRSYIGRLGKLESTRSLRRGSKRPTGCRSSKGHSRNKWWFPEPQISKNLLDAHSSDSAFTHSQARLGAYRVSPASLSVKRPFRFFCREPRYRTFRRASALADCLDES